MHFCYDSEKTVSGPICSRIVALYHQNSHQGPSTHRGNQWTWCPKRIGQAVWSLPLDDLQLDTWIYFLGSRDFFYLNAWWRSRKTWKGHIWKDRTTGGRGGFDVCLQSVAFGINQTSLASALSVTIVLQTGIRAIGDIETIEKVIDTKAKESTRKNHLWCTYLTYNSWNDVSVPNGNKRCIYPKYYRFGFC